MLDLRQFRQFIAVAEALSFRRAAERLHMSQPPLTAAIRQMEQALGVRLFERTNRITAMTEAGRVLLEEARRTVAQAERAVVLTQRAGAGMIGSLRVGFVASAVGQGLAHRLARFRTTHPELALELREKTTAQQVAGLIDDDLDLGLLILPLPRGCQAAIATRTVLSSRLVAALPPGHCLARRAEIALAALAQEPWIMFPETEGPGLYDAILTACAHAGFRPQVAQRAVQMATIVGLVAAGLGVALVPEAFGGDGWPSAAFRPLTGPGTPVAYEAAVAWRRDDRSPALAAFLAMPAEAGS